MAIKLVVFDMAGTTVYDENHVSQALQQALQKHGFSFSLETINPLMGYKKPLAIRMLLTEAGAEITDTLIDQIHEDFVRDMLTFYQTSTDLRALPDVEETFVRLRQAGIKVGLDTGFSRDIAEVIVQRLDWQDAIDHLVASDDVANGRPYPDMIYQTMQTLGITQTEEVAKVGDTEVDMNEGRNAGCRYVIGVTTGTFTREELLQYEPTHTVDSVAEVVDIVLA